MKKALIAVLVLSFSSIALAGKYGPAGCGLGNMVLKEKKGLVWNVLAATLNGTSGNQTFGMTSGTSECDVNDRTKVAQVNYIEANKIALANDIARGNGETLASLGELYGCSNLTSMGQVLQTNYETIFSNDSAEKINSNIQSLIVENKACI